MTIGYSPESVVGDVRMRQLLPIILNNKAYVSITFLVVQQLLVAATVYMSVRISVGLSIGDLDKNELYLLVVLSLSAFFPGLASSYFYRRWAIESASQYWLKRHDHLLSTSDNHVHAVYLVQARDAIMELASFCHRAASVLLNSLVSAAIIGVFLSASLFSAYLVGVTMAAILMYVARSRLKKRASNESEMASNLTAVLRETKANLTFGAAVNRRSWRDELGVRLQDLRDCINQNAWLQMVINGSAALLIAAPILVVIFTIDEKVLLIAVAVNLPRLFQIINSSLELFGIASNYFAVSGYIQVVIDAENTYHEQLEDRIHLADLSIGGRNFSSVKSVIDYLKDMPTGIIYVKGRNGAGKSTLLRRISSDLDADYFNPKLRPIWPHIAPHGLSDGEYTGYAIHQLIENSQGPIFLDEWNGFLDPSAEKKLGKSLESASEQRLVVLVEQKGTKS